MICIPLFATTNQGMLDQLRHAETEPVDVHELRLDSLKEPPDLPGLIAASTRPVVATCRSLADRGGFAGSDEERRAILMMAGKSGAAYIDAELKDVPFLAGKIGDAVLIGSHHDFYGTPDNLSERVREMATMPCDWVKMVVTYRKPLDNIRVLEAIRSCRKPVIAIAMGEGGIMTRILGPAYGSRFTYGEPERGFEAAPGKPTARDLALVYRVADLTPETPVFGLLGNPVAHSRSFRIHNRAFSQLGIDGVFIPFLAASAEDFLNTVPNAINLHGLSVTMPHKMAAARWADICSENASRLGAANTLTLTEKGWRANSTDLPAIFETIKAATFDNGINLTGGSALVLGAGGTSRAAALALTLLGCRVTISAIDSDSAWRAASVDGMEWDVEDWNDALHANWDIVANTTPVGMYPNVGESPFPASNWRDGMLAFDVVHNPQETQFLKDAAAAGAIVVDGVQIFLRQIADQFRHWTGEELPKITSLTWRREKPTS
ncbi:MAG: type I 3-dehydroquinate dehydratase [Planctomycetaceae bacterium]|nr:type I 3-dehydroquinate dehydratase [Planctomycetaceae bacterium]